MNKRKFLKQSMLVSAGVCFAPSVLLAACKSDSKKENLMETTSATTAIFELPKLPYGYDAFPDTIDPLTMEIHYTKHHQGYTDKLNAALKENAISENTIEEILSMDNLPTAIRNNGGGYYNHNLYWDVLTPGGEMSDTFKSKIIENFGSEESFLNELADAGAKRFGSGWAWVVQGKDKKLRIFSTPNQDNPLMKVVDINGTPILGIDVWEHAYYLKYQNKRTEYLQKILKIINWNKVEERMI
ncbi:superoxide dismutase [Xanthomarina sp.]|uniref:superoxide dismutase n=1 Tax=Xanthomarina sp. TaxID=1931211 RepID=UPI002D00F7C2|nr:superoxide dismutase [Xanthomarina sp.]HLV38593.1 superoxide dismutase [Xanthomarina sp.]